MQEPCAENGNENITKKKRTINITNNNKTKQNLFVKKYFSYIQA